MGRNKVKKGPNWWDRLKIRVKKSLGRNVFLCDSCKWDWRSACHNPDRPARGKVGCGNIGIHRRKERHYICRVCGKTYRAKSGKQERTESKNTVSYK